MAQIKINNCQMVYESFGQDTPHQAPVILIHGSTQTGLSCWGLAAPLLARNRRVLVPDCRGHGRSSNPGQSYSFKEMADDIASLVVALGYPRAHIIGHSNGGNVALVTLLEHPEIVQSAVLQAANAYVSADLIEKEPAVFDPERVSREAPQWKEEMIALHGETHGLEYWQKLLAMTVKEIISEPNYTPADLAQVIRPTLVIQGANDQVNAPSQHGEFIAGHIPDAELWRPSNVGHSVHDDVLFEWITKVEDFLNRRGDDLNNALHTLKRQHYRDRRVTIFEPRADHVACHEPPRLVRLTGKVLKEQAHQEALELIQKLAGCPVEDEIDTLLDQAAWGLINRPVNDLRAQPSNRAERISQALLGEVTQVLQNIGEWSLVRLEKDGYLGWIHTNAVHQVSQEVVRAYQGSCNGRVQAELLQSRALDFPRDVPGEQEGKIPFGVRLPVIDYQDDSADIRLPDGRIWRAARVGILTDFYSLKPDQEGIHTVLKLIRRFIGVPYLWGGRSPFGYDCSGLAQTVWDFLGVSIPRDADQQFQAGMLVDGPAKPGDLLFFGDPDPINQERFANISHVAISLGESEFIHANGTAWGVGINSLDPSSNTGYRSWYAENLVGVRRFA